MKQYIDIIIKNGGEMQRKSFELSPIELDKYDPKKKFNFKGKTDEGSIEIYTRIAPTPDEYMQLSAVGKAGVYMNENQNRVNKVIQSVYPSPFNR